MTPPSYLTPTKASMAKAKRERIAPSSVFATASTTSTPSTFTSSSSSSSSHSAKVATPSSRFTPSLSSPRYLTPTKSKENAAPIRSTTPKLLYLIRHGESMGQAAKKLGLDRRRDERLRDASLTKRGIWQATQLIEYEFAEPIELIVSSPLTRALNTALLGFPSPRPPLLVHYDLAELGSRVPENMPRKFADVLKDLHHDGTGIDSTTLMPPSWPNISYDSKLNRSHAIHRAMQYLYKEREEQCIVVVCHFNVIRQIVDNSLRPENAKPIACELRPSGEVVLQEELAQVLIDFGQGGSR